MRRGPRNRFRFQPSDLRIPATLVLAVLAGCSHGVQAEGTAAAGKPELPVVKAAVLTVRNQPWPAIVGTQGSLIADEVTIVGAKVAGRVADVDVDLGDVVQAEAPFATLDQEEFKLQIMLAEAQLVQARAALGLRPNDPVESLDPLNAPPVREAEAVLQETQTRSERIRQLRSRNAVTQEELDTAMAAEGVAEARYGSAVNGVREKIAQIGVRAAELSLAQQRLDDTVIRAPFEGLVQERHVARGSFVQVGSPIVTLLKTSRLRFRGTMPERHAHRLEPGQQVTLSIEGMEQPRAALITRISPGVDESNRSLVFEAEVKNEDGALRTGLFAEAEVIVDPDGQALVIPPTALVEFAGAEKVWKLVDGIAQEQIVQTVHRGDGGLAVVSGLVAGDQILRHASQGRVAKIEPVLEAVTATASTSTAPPTENNELTSSETPAFADSPSADNGTER